MAESPKEIRTDAALDGATDILRHHQPVQRFVTVGPGGRQKYWCALRDRLRIDRDAASGGQRYAQSADRPG